MELRAVAAVIALAFLPAVAGAQQRVATAVIQVSAQVVNTCHFGAAPRCAMPQSQRIVTLDTPAETAAVGGVQRQLHHL